MIRLYRLSAAEHQEEVAMANLTATAETEIDAPAAQVWRALTEPEIIARYFFGTKVETDWQPGSPIIWRGVYQGKSYEDKGRVLDVEPHHMLKVTHFSPMSGLPDEPESYHTLTFRLDEHGQTTRVLLTQDNNGDEAEAQQATENWQTMLGGLKKTVEEG
jgi:uncharacterized protein YndB with AHSA1/START domain